MNNASSSASTIQRQMELTLGALARSARKAIRAADKEAPNSTGALWQVVEHRLQLLENMLRAVGEFHHAIDPAPEAPAEEAANATEVPLAEAELPAAPATSASTSPAPTAPPVSRKIPRPIHNTPPKPINIRPQTSGKGWRLVA